MQRRRFLLTLAAAAHAPWAAAQPAASPQRVTLYVPFPPGGASDALARQVAPRLEQVLRQTVVVENLPGASGTLAAQRMLAATPDGNAIMVVSSSETIMPPLLMSGVKFQAEDFRLLVGAMHAPVALLARPGLPFDTLQGLLDHARQPAQAKLSYGSLGYGTIAHLAAEHFARLTGAEMIHVPYRGGTPLVNDLVGNQVDLSFLPFAGSILQLAEAGRMKVLGVASSERLPRLAKFAALTDHPALTGFVHSAWNSFAVSKKVPDALATRLNQVFNTVLQSAEMRAVADGMGSHMPPAATLAEADAFYAREIATTRAMAQAVDLRVQ